MKFVEGLRYPTLLLDESNELRKRPASNGRTEFLDLADVAFGYTEKFLVLVELEVWREFGLSKE
jgi:hypothetical protein